MTKDRQIVFMLILRKRLAYRLYVQHTNNNNNNWNTSVRDCLYAEYCEAANAAELARRILYGYKL